MLIKTKYIKDPQAFDRLLNQNGCHRIPTINPGVNCLEVMQRNQGPTNDRYGIIPAVIGDAVRRGILWPQAIETPKET